MLIPGVTTEKGTRFAGQRTLQRTPSFEFLAVWKSINLTPVNLLRSGSNPLRVTLLADWTPVSLPSLGSIHVFGQLSANR